MFVDVYWSHTIDHMNPIIDLTIEIYAFFLHSDGKYLKFLSRNPRRVNFAFLAS